VTGRPPGVRTAGGGPVFGTDEAARWRHSESRPESVWVGLRGGTGGTTGAVGAGAATVFAPCAFPLVSGDVVYSVERGDDAPGAAAVVTVAAGLGRAALSVAVLDVIWPGA